jgi:dihydrofolate reductase
MGKTILDMSMSLDGFVAGPNETPENGLGDGGERLHEWIFAGEETAEGGVPARPGGVDGEMIDAMTATGAVVAGRGTVDPANWWHGEHHGGVPIFILSRTRTPESVEQWPLLSVLGDVTEAFDRARAAAGERDVLVHGVGVGREALALGILDEVQLHLVPTVLGEGRRLFEGVGPGPRDLELLRLVEGEGATHLRYRVLG